MKKQIFKLTSILLAMVMVFSLFTIIPISAEGVDKATAVSNLKAAWEALEYNGYLTSVSHTYCNYNSADAWNPTWSIDPDAPDSANGPESKLNFVIDLTGKNDSNNFYAASAITNSSRIGQIMPEYDLVGVNDVWFYYKTEADLPVMAQIQFQKNNGSASVNCSFSGWYSLPATNGEWVLYSLNKLITDNATVTFESRIKNHSGDAVNHPLVGQVGFNFYAPTDTKISLGDIFFEGDPNLADTYNFTDDEWIVKVVDTDLTELKAQYNDAEDSATWTAFVDAFNVVKDSFGAEVVQIQAVENLKNAWQALEETQKTFVNVLAPEYWWDASSTKNTATYSSDTTYGYLSSITGVTSTGYAASASAADPFLFLYGDGGRRFKLNGYKDLGFWFKATSDISARLNLTISSSYGVTETVLTGDNEWHFVSLREVMGETTWTSVYDTIKDTGLYRIYVDMGAIVDPEVSSVDVTFGGAYATPIFTGADGLEGEDLVVAAYNVDLNRFADCAEKTAFESALANALEAFSDIADAILKGKALSNLRTEWVKMIEDTPVINSTYTHYGFWNASATKEGCSTVTTDKYGKAYTRTGVTNTASQFGNGKDTTANLLLYQAGATVAFGNYLDAGFWYNATSDINVQISLMFASSIQDANIAQGVLTGDGQWHFLSFKEFFGETLWASIRTQYATANATHRFYVDLGNIVDSNVSSVDVTFGGAGGMLTDTTVSAITDDNLVTSAIEVDTANYVDATAFKEALSEALEFYPDLKEEIELANTVRDLKNTWKNLTYIPQQINTAPLRGYQTGGSNATKTIFVDGDDASKGYLTSADGVGTAYLFPAEDYKDSNGNSTPYEWFVWGNVGSNIFLKEDIESFGFWYKSESQITGIRVIVQASTYLTSNGGVLPATGGEWSFITIEELAGTTVWNSFLSNANLTDISDFRLMFTNSTARSTEIYFGDLVVYGKDEQIEGIDTWSNEELAINADKANLDVYEDGAELKAQFATLTAKLKEIYAANFAAQDVIDAANKLSGLGLKPSTLIEHAQFDEEGEWAGAGASYSANTNYLSNNGDQYVEIDTVTFGEPSCSPNAGAVQYEAVADGGIKLADIDDISFSYKIANKVGDTTVARIWFYNENYARYLRTENEEGDEEFVLDDEGNKIIDRNNWQTGMEAYGTTRYFAVDADTDGWVTTSIATIFGSDWKTHYLGYLNGSDIKTEDFTADNTYITKLGLGFNGYNIEGDYADVTLGSMYVDYADDRFAIDAGVADPAAVLAEALTIDASGCKKADADAFKKAVKALADALEENISAANCVAGNNAVTLVDLSLLARYVDAADKDAFVANNYIDLIAADINDDDVINEADITALRLAMLTPAED